MRSALLLRSLHVFQLLAYLNPPLPILVQQLDELDALLECPEVAQALTLLASTPLDTLLATLNHFLHDLNHCFSLTDATYLSTLQCLLYDEVLFFIQRNRKRGLL